MAAKPLHEFLGGKTRFGKLTVVRDCGSLKGRRRIECRCDCGTSKDFDGQHLKRGNSRSCGCEIVIGKPTHGKFYEPGYARWNAMMSRCYHENNKHFHDYGGRGIRVCERWHDVTAFLEDMGNPPEGMSLDRIDHNGNYEPSNVRWADDHTQARNKRTARIISCNGKQMTVVEAADKVGLSPHVIYKRLDLGWSDTDALIPVGAKRHD